MPPEQTPIALFAADAPSHSTSSYPPTYAARVSGRRKQVLGDVFGLTGLGINRTILSPGSQSSLRHRHFVQDEFVFMLSGELVLVSDTRETRLAEGMCAGFPAGGAAHHLINRSNTEAVYLEIGDRRDGDSAEYPDDDLAAERDGNSWRFTRKNGTPY